LIPSGGTASRLLDHPGRWSVPGSRRRLRLPAPRPRIRGRVGGAHCCAPPPSDSVRATRRGIRLKQAPLGGSGVEECWFLRGAGGPALAVRVDKAGAVRCACARFGGHVVLGDRFAGDPVPLLPFGGAGWLVVGVQEQPCAERAAAFLLGEQDQDAAVEQGLVLAAPLGPVVGQGGVVRGRRAEDQTVSWLSGLNLP